MLRQSVRSLRKSPAYSITAVLTLGLGIGLTTAAFSLLNGFVLRPLPFAEPDSLVDVSEWSETELCAGCGVGTSYRIYQEWRRSAHSFTSMEAAVERPFSVAGTRVGEHPPQRVTGALVSARLFDLLGVSPITGRPFTPIDDSLGAPAVAIVSYDIWKERLGGGSLEQAVVRLNGTPHVIVGVMPAGFGYPEFARVWVPLGAHAADWANDDRSLGVVARLAPGVSLTQARDEMTAIAHGIGEQFPASHRAWTTVVTPLREGLAGEEAQLFWILVAMVFVVLLIACVNLAGVGLARASARERELAVRVALGASHRNLVSLLLGESLCLAAAGGLLGVMLAQWGVDLARALLPAQLPFWLRFDLDWRVFLFCGLVTMAAGLASGLLPAFRSARPDLVPALKTGTGASADGRQLRFWLLGGELALALVLLVGAGLLTRTFVRAVQFDPGYDVENLLTADISLDGARYDGDGATLVADSVLERLQRHRGVSGAAVSHTAFVAGFGGTDRVMEVEGRPVPAGASPRFSYAVTSDYFRTLGLPLLAGRGFSVSDGAGAAQVAIVNDALASRIWPGESPLGRHLRLPGGEWRTIVGVAGNVGGSPLALRPQRPANVYVPFAQAPGRPIVLHLRAAGTPALLAPALAEAVASIDRDQPVENIRSAEDAMRDWILPARAIAALAGSVAGLALVLAAVGLYGVVAYTVGRRTREFGIRLAIGATATDVLVLVLRQAMTVTLIGVGVGLAGAAASTGVLRTMLFGTDPLDPMVFLASAGVLALVMTSAALIPARRAARTSPQVALRDE